MSELRRKIRQALIELVGKRDPSVFQDAEVFAGKLKEIGRWPDMAEISALKAGLLERFPWELQKNPDRIVSPGQAALLAHKLVKKYRFDEDEAYWAVETWGIALGLKTELPTPKSGKVQAPSSQQTEAKKAPPGFEPDTSNTRLGVIFGVDESGLTRVYKSWFGNAPVNEANKLAATTVKIEKKPQPPLFSAAPRKSGKVAKKDTVSTGSNSKSFSDAPKLIKKSGQAQTDHFEEIKDTVKKQVQQEPNAGDKYLNMANTMLPGGKGRLNVKEALKLLQQAVKLGSIKARRRFGEIYLRGIGVKENLPNAASWYKTAAKLGDAESQFQLGSLYQCGIGVKRDLEQAQKWLQQAADQGHEGAMELLNQILSP